MNTDGQDEGNPLDDGHIRSRPRIKASIATAKTTIPATASKSPMAEA